MDAKLLDATAFRSTPVLKAGTLRRSRRRDKLGPHGEDPVRRVRLDQSSSPSSARSVCNASIKSPRGCRSKAAYEAIWLQGAGLAPGQISETYCHGTHPALEYLRRGPRHRLQFRCLLITEPPPAWSIRSRTGPGDGGGFRRKASQWRDRWCEHLLLSPSCPVNGCLAVSDRCLPARAALMEQTSLPHTPVVTLLLAR